MRTIAELRGLRFPDEYVVKMFFKEGLHKAPGIVLEMGCGNGNNLLLFAAFGWSVTGVDYDAAALEDAKFNLEGQGDWIECDLSKSLPPMSAPGYPGFRLRQAWPCMVDHTACCMASRNG